MFVNHGDDTVCDAFAETITQTLGYPATAPYNGAIYDVATGMLLEQGNRVRLERKSAKQKRSDSVFDRLLSAGKRLMMLIEKSKGRPNKELAKFADQINRLADKWEE